MYLLMENQMKSVTIQRMPIITQDAPANTRIKETKKTRICTQCDTDDSQWMSRFSEFNQTCRQCAALLSQQQYAFSEFVNRARVYGRNPSYV